MRIYRASSLGGCLKAQAAEALGYEAVRPPEQLEMLFREGDLHEGAVKESLRDDNYVIDWEQKTVNLIITRDVVLQGHLDGRIVYPEKGEFVDYPMVLEIKSMGTEPWKKFCAKTWRTGGLIDKYKWQVSAYMLATRLPLFFIAKNRDNGRVKIEIVREPFYSLNEIKTRVLSVDEWVVKGELPGTCEESYPCPFHYLHSGKGDGGRVEDEPPPDDFYGLALRAFATAQALKEAQAENKAARQALREVMGERKRCSFGDITVNVSSRRNVSFDREKMEAAGVDPVEFEVVNFTEVLTVKKKEEDKNDAS